jgi:hypothetical protein
MGRKSREKRERRANGGIKIVRYDASAWRDGNVPGFCADDGVVHIAIPEDHPSHDETLRFLKKGARKMLTAGRQDSGVDVEIHVLPQPHVN